MLRNKPRFSYCGVTIVLDRPSRFDKVALLSANGGQYLNECLAPEHNIYQCDVRVKEDKEPLLPGTKVLLLLGEEAFRSWLPAHRNNTLNEVRGSCYRTTEGTPVICSYYPQDAVDIKNYEKEHNPLLANQEDEDDDKIEEDDSAVKRHSKTKRKNYSFWLKEDVKHVKYLLKCGEPPKREFEPEYVIYPSSEQIIRVLQENKQQDFFFDCETDAAINITCFSFNFGNSHTIYCVPVLYPDYSWAYSNLHHVFRALVIAMEDNISIAHNGAAFDFFHLGNKYHIPVGAKVKDTMLMHHRCFPEVEKSLGHGISLWAWQEQFHKDENAGYNNKEQMMRTLQYCGKDVFTMRLVHNAILGYARRHPGLTESIEQVNASIRPYLITALQGIKYREEILRQTMKENDELMMQYLRCINLLVGETTLKKLRSRFKSAMPSSNPQCVEYFHNLLGYPVMGRGKTSKKTGLRKASLAKKNMFKLRLKFDNPVIDFIIAYRELAKESGTLKFTPHKTT